MARTFVLAVLTTLSLPWLLLAAWLRSLSPTRPRRVLIIQAAKIGDLLCMTPLFRALHEHGDHVTVLCLQRTAPVLAGNPCVQDTLILDDDRFKGFRGALRLWRAFFQGRFAVTITPFPASSLSMMGLWAAAPVCIYTRGRVISLMERWFRLFYSLRTRYRRHTRTYDHYMTLARLAGAQAAPYRHEFFLREEEQQEAAAWLRARGIGPRFAALSLRAGNTLKEWPVERFAAVARHIIERHKLPVVFLDTDARVTGEALTALGNTASAFEAHDLSLRQLAALIAHSSLFVSVDTGPLYMAHAFGVPLVDIVGPVDPLEQPPPDGEKAAIVLPPAPIQPISFVADTLRTPTPAQRAALDGTTVAMVTAAVDRLLSRVS